MFATSTPTFSSNLAVNRSVAGVSFSTAVSFSGIVSGTDALAHAGPGNLTLLVADTCSAVPGTNVWTIATTSGSLSLAFLRPRD